MLAFGPWIVILLPLVTYNKSEVVPEKLFPLFPEPPKVRVLFVAPLVLLIIEKLDVPLMLKEPNVADAAVNEALAVVELKIPSVVIDGVALGFQFVLVPMAPLDPPVQVLCVLVCPCTAPTETTTTASKLKLRPSLKTEPAIFETGRRGRRWVLRFSVDFRRRWKRARLKEEASDLRESVGAPVRWTGRTGVRGVGEWCIVVDCLVCRNRHFGPSVCFPRSEMQGASSDKGER